MKINKLNLLRVLGTLVLGVALVSCEEPTEQKEAKCTTFIVTADTLADSGASLGKAWAQGEQVNVWNGKTTATFTSSQSNKGTTAMFMGETDNTGNFVVYYPAAASSTAEQLTFAVSAEQKAVKDKVAEEGYVLVGKSTTNNVKLSNVLGYLAISIERENIKTATFEPKSSAGVAGNVTVSVADLSCSVQAGAKSVTLRAENNGTLAKGTYYFAVLPQTVNGYAVKFVDENGKESELTSEAELTITGGSVISLGDDAILNASLEVACENAEVIQKGDRVTISVDSGNSGWTSSFAAECEWLTEVSRTETELVYELNRTHLTNEDLTAELTIVNDLNPALKETVTITLSSHVLFDARFKEDGTAYDASKYNHTIETIQGDYMYTYFNKTANRYVARYNCTTPGGNRSTSLHKFVYKDNQEFKDQIADNHSIECLCMLDQALDGQYNYEVKPFSSMESGGTGFVIGATNNGNKMFFLPNTGSWVFGDTKIVMEEGVYYHLIGTFDAASKETKVYVNGKLYGTFTNNGDNFKFPPYAAQWFAIGGDSASNTCGNGWRGDVVTSKIFDKVLSQEDVSLLWNEANVGLPSTTVKYDVVLFGDSITQYWMSSSRGNPTFFTDNNWFNRGISGNTTADMLARFKYDLELLAPKVMVFCGGTNDIAQNDGVFVSNDQILENIKTMVTRAEAVGTTVILCSLLPANKYYWSSAIADPSQEIMKVNELIKAYAAEKGIRYVDYWTPLHDSANGMPEKYSSDGVHPNKDCYLIMQDILKPVVTDVLSKLK